MQNWPWCGAWSNDGAQRAVTTSDDGKFEFTPILLAAMRGAQHLVAFYLDECGIDVNMATPHRKETVLHVLIKLRPTSKREAVRLLKYLVEEKGADIRIKNAAGDSALQLAMKCNNTTYFRYLSSFEAGNPLSVPGLAPSDEWGSAEEEEKEWRETMMLSRGVRDAARMILKKREAQAKKAEEAEAKALFDEKEVKTKEATAALLAELDTEDRQAAAAAAKKKSKKNGNEKKGAGIQQQQPQSTAPVDVAVGRGVGAEECKADDKKLAPQSSLQMMEEEEQGQEGAPYGAADAAAAVVAVSMDRLSLEEEEKTDTCSSAGAMGKDDEDDFSNEEDLEEEKHDFVFDGAPDGLKCSVGFCLMTEAVTAMDGFAYQKSSLDEYIAHCTAKGQPLTLPLTAEPMNGMYIPMQNVRTLVKDYIEQREKEWSLRLEQRRGTSKTGK